MRKTIALTCILKNELHNLPRFCESVRGCFDEYHFTDTGSTDGSVAWLMNDVDKYLGSDAKVFIHHFSWIRNFAAARNYAIEFVNSDYWMWMDLDDVLFNKENFLAWRDEAMSTADFWYVPYHYALKELSADAEPAVSFIRERIIKKDTGLQFTDFIHEGIDIRKSMRPIMAQVVSSFSIKHMRTDAEAAADRGRNLEILEENKDILSPRLEFYYGKELFDHHKYAEAARVLRENVKRKEMEQGDRIMAFQYLVHSLNFLEEYGEAIKYGILGIQMEPNRAEYHCLVADSFIKLGEPNKAIPFFSAAKACHNSAAGGISHEFAFGESYSFIPRMNLGHIYTSQGRFEEALAEVRPLLPNEKAKEMVDFCEKAIRDTKIPPNEKLLEVDDIVITCPFPNAYDWDEEIYKSKGLGGSETAAVEVAMHLKKITGKSVKVFQHRKEKFISKSGVEYIPAPELHHYFQKYKPQLHIAWRHTARFTNALSVVWSHDLQTPGAENHQNYDKILALSEFHKTFMMGTQGVPRDKILVTRNGINPSRFAPFLDEPKQPGKVVWSNSPDRGLEFAIEIMDLVHEQMPEAELHVFYGFDNMYKYGLGQKADNLKHMFCTRPWIKYHGNVDQVRLAAELCSSEVWLYPASFIETYCISAIEALAAKTWPVVRRFGALKSTMRQAEERGWGDILDVDMNDEAIPIFADKVLSALKEQKYKKIDFDSETVSWASLAHEWVEMFKLN